MAFPPRVLRSPGDQCAVVRNRAIANVSLSRSCVDDFQTLPVVGLQQTVALFLAGRHLFVYLLPGNVIVVRDTMPLSKHNSRCADLDSSNKYICSRA